MGTQTAPAAREAPNAKAPSTGLRVGSKKRSLLGARIPLWPVVAAVGAMAALNLYGGPPLTPPRMRADLSGRVAVVTGASRGIGRGIALGLGEKGATVYVTGRSEDAVRATAEEITARGGRGVPVVCDHSSDAAIAALFEMIEKEEGKLDILVNNCYSAVRELAPELSTLGQGDHIKKFWEKGLDWWDKINNVGLRAHFIASQHAVPLMLRSARFDVAYGVGKAAKDRMAHDMAMELKNKNIASVGLWPGPVHTEVIQEEVVAKGAPSAEAFVKAESTEYSGRAVASLALDEDVMKMTGRTLLTADLGDRYSFNDIHGKPIASIRSLKGLVGMASPSAARFVPAFIKIPFWVLDVVSSKF